MWTVRRLRPVRNDHPFEGGGDESNDGRRLSRSNHLQSSDLRKMSRVKSGHGAPAFQRSGRQNDIVEADHFASRFQTCPQSSVFERSLLSVRDDRQRLKDRLKILLALAPMDAGCAFYSVPKFGNSDGSYFQFLVCQRCRPSFEVEGSPLAPDDHIGVQDYCHRSTGALSILRAAIRSRRQAFASSFGNSILAKAAARSRPVQIFSASGTRRATGAPFFSKTKVTF